MKPTFLCGASILQLETPAAQWGWTRINKGWGWRTPRGTEVRHTHQAGRIEEIIAAARGQGFDVRQAGQHAGDPLERVSWPSSSVE